MLSGRPIILGLAVKVAVATMMILAANAAVAESMVVTSDIDSYALNDHLEELRPCVHSDDPSELVQELQKCQGAAVQPSFLMRFSPRRIWLQFVLDNPSSSPVPLIVNNDLALADMILVDAAKPTVQMLAGVSRVEEQNIGPLSTGMKFVVPPGRSTYYLGISSSYHPISLSLNLRSPAAYAQSELKRAAFLSLLFGALLSLLVYNLFIAITNRSKLNTFYLAGLAATTMVQVILTGAHTLLGSKLAVIAALTWTVWMGAGYVLFVWFAAEYYGTYRTSKGALLYLRFINVLGVLFIGCYFINPAVVLPVTCVLAIAPIVWLARTGLRRERNRRQNDLYFLLANAPLALGGLLMLTQPLGLLPYSRLISDVFFVCVVLQQLLSSLVAGSSARRQLIERTKIQSSVELGRSVQDLLLPERLSGQSAGFDYLFVYKPFENLMSGDWISAWTTSDGAHHFIVGDVVGKGPQAALAVASITTTIKAMIRADQGVQTTLQAVDQMLREVFSGHVSSAYSAVSIDTSFVAELFNGGGRGWYAFSNRKVRHFVPRGPLLGPGGEQEFSGLKLALSDDSAVFTLTDGICDGPVDGKRLAKLAGQLLSEGTSLEGLASQLLQLKPAALVHDDQTMLIVKRHPVVRHLHHVS